MKTWTHSLLLGVVLLGATTLQAADLQEARDLKNHGRYEESVRAYQEALEADPGDQVALRELAQVISWMGRYDEAITLYKQALEQDPSDDEAMLGLARTHSWALEHRRSLAMYDHYLERHPDDATIRLERAKVQSWSGDFQAAIDVYEDHLTRTPEDQAVRLELAKVLSWSGELDESIRTYREVLEAEPENLEAQVGLARTLSWSGELGEADELYDAILNRHPDDVGARLGKAQLAIWRGETRQGHRILDEIEAASPGTDEVERYRKELQRSRRPVLESSSDRVQDSDGNDYQVHRLSLTGHLTPFTTLAGVLRRTDTSFAGQDARVDFAGLRLGVSLPHGVALRATAGIDFIDPSPIADDADSHSRGVGSVAAFGPIAGTWRWNAAVDHRTFDAVREVVDNDVTFRSVTGGADGRWGDWRAGAAGGWTDFSDDNRRLHATVYVLYSWDLPGDVNLEVGYRFRWMEFDENLDSGYFDPQSFHSNLATVSLSGPLGTPRADWAVRVDGGVQSFRIDENVIGSETLEGGEQTNDSVFGWQVQLGIDLHRHARLEVYYGETDFALQSATGFDSEQWGALLRYRF